MSSNFLVICTARCLRLSSRGLACLLFSIAVLVSGVALADHTPFFVEDFAPGTVEESSFRQAVASADGRLLFWANDGRRGSELWITDGTPGGTHLWTEVCPGDCADVTSDEDFLGEVVFDGSRAFFVIDDSVHGPELWTADGSDEGTQLVADVCPGPCDAEINSLALIGEHLFFVADDPLTGEKARLWVSDGSAEGTRQVGDLGVFNQGRFDETFFPFADGAVFQASTPEHGIEWWSSDGTVEGTERRSDICPGECSAFAIESAAFGDGILFTVISETFGVELFRLLPNESPTTLGELCDGGCPNHSPLHQVGDSIYFSLASELWVTDGTAEGTSIVAPLLESFFHVTSIAQLSDGALVLSVLQEPYDAALYRLDGQEFVGPLFVGEDGTRFAYLDESAVFVEPDRQLAKVWRSDGTAQGTQVIDQLPGDYPNFSFIHSTQRLGDQVLFGANTREDFRVSELWTTSGQASDLILLLGLESRPLSSDPQQMTSLNTDVLWTTEGEGFEAGDLWAIDDLGSIQRLLTGVEPTDLVALNLAVGHRAFFNARIEPYDIVPWLTDGSSGTLFELGENEEPRLYRAREPQAFNGELIFLAEQGGGQKIWRNSGLSPEVELVVDLRPDWLNIFEGCPICSPPIYPTPIFPRELQVVGHSGPQRLAFVGGQEASGAEIWLSDGTAEGTSLLSDLLPGEEGSEPEDLMPAGEGLVFTADAGAGRKLWVWDGLGAPQMHSEAGIVIAKTTWEGKATWIQQGLSEGGPGSDFVVMTSDGTPAGTQIVGSLPTGHVPDDEAVVIGDFLFFGAADAQNAELWVSDLPQGQEGIRQVTDLWPGSRGSFPQHLRTFEQQLFFSADDGVHGRELWSLDPFRENLGPTFLGDIAPGAEPSSPSAVAVLNAPTFSAQFVLFGADDGIAGSELWITDVPSLPQTCQSSDDFLCLFEGRYRVSVDWQDNIRGTSGKGHAVQAGGQTGFFWFFDQTNLELAVKLIDGLEFNDAHWFFYGALSDVEYQILVEDLTTGARQIYSNDQGNLCGQADINAFPRLESSAGVLLSTPPANPQDWNVIRLPATESEDLTSTLQRGTFQDETFQGDSAAQREKSKASTCVNTSDRLCLLGRFQIDVHFKDHDGNEGTAQVFFTDNQTGTFWFFDILNIELVIKAIDGRDFNDQWWIFYGALSDVEYRITVRDTVTGVEKIYFNEAGNFCGRGDTEAFPG